jgi:hypothetical protein
MILISIASLLAALACAYFGFVAPLPGILAGFAQAGVAIFGALFLGLAILGATGHGKTG